MKVDSNMRGVIAAVMLSSILNLGGMFMSQRDGNLKQAMRLEAVEDTVALNKRNILDLAKNVGSMRAILVRIETIMELSVGGQYASRQPRSKSYRQADSPDKDTRWLTKPSYRSRNE